MQSTKRNHALTALASIAVLIAMAAGWHLELRSDLADADTADSLMEVRFEVLTIAVEDESENPVEGALLELTGLEMRGRSHGWSQQEDGPKTYSTDPEGQAIVRYPVEAIRAKGQPTRSLVLSVDHPDFAYVFRTVFPVNGSTGPIRLTRGMEMEVCQRRRKNGVIVAV